MSSKILSRKGSAINWKDSPGLKFEIKTEVKTGEGNVNGRDLVSVVILVGHILNYLQMNIHGIKK